MAATMLFLAVLVQTLVVVPAMRDVTATLDRRCAEAQTDDASQAERRVLLEQARQRVMKQQADLAVQAEALKKQNEENLRLARVLAEQLRESEQ